jgi:hypothetical protein
LAGLPKQNDAGVVERAFQIARDGKHGSISEIAVTLRKEGYEQASAHLSGPTISRQLRAAMANARADKHATSETM